MVNVADAFCIDRFEASRPDATDTSPGLDESVAFSREDVLPWQLDQTGENTTARSACLAAGKDLCTSYQWTAACQGPAKTIYGYGDAYEPATCNGIDLFGLGGFRVLPTGSLAGCRNGWGAFDMNGNLWEHTLDGSERTVRGGAYNCKDSQTLHRCDYVPSSWTPSARGFRCCLVPDGATPPPDAGTEASVLPDGGDASDDIGCLEEDAMADAPQDVTADGADDASPDVQDGAPPDGPDAALDASPDAPQDASSETSLDANSQCPSDMVRVQAGPLDFCMDVYEASHADATPTWQGQSAVAASQLGVLPWFPVTLASARAACTGAGKRLCKLDEWIEGCQGPSKTTYAYGNDYDPVACNGIDTFCDCGSASCGGLSVCPYPHCYMQASSEGGGPCGADFHVMPTGSFPRCVSPYGASDVNGNVWELADSTDGLEHFRGGAYNCGNSELLHRCDHDGTWGPSARGFRCCKDPE